VPISDTTPEAQAVWLRIQRSMTGEQRILAAIEICEFAREMARAGIKHDHPEWGEPQIKRELLRRAFLPDPLPPGLPDPLP
jgi:hypothetical protein